MQIYSHQGAVNFGGRGEIQCLTTENRGGKIANRGLWQFRVVLKAWRAVAV